MKSIVKYALENRAVTYLLVSLLVLGGGVSFFSLGQLEDPVFSIKSCSIVTRYPGASPREVELEVTDRIELAIQQMTQLKDIYSTSRAGESIIKVDIQEKYWSDQLPQIWDELRKKIRDIENDFPPGVETPQISDDFGFVYGFLIALTGDGFSDRELERYADSIKKEMSLVEGVTRVELWGVQKEAIYLDINQQQLATLGITGETFYDTLRQQNMVVDAGKIDIGNERFRIAPTGYFTNIEDIANLQIRPRPADLLGNLISAPEKTSEALKKAGEEARSHIITVKDIANVRKGYIEPPVSLMRYNGEPAIGIQIAGSEQENIVSVGNRLKDELEDIKSNLPVGLELHPIAWQSDLVDESVSDFLVNLMQAIVIVLVVLIIPSGFRMGFIIGFDLLITILGTFIFMSLMDIPLQRMSLGALIIAMGMMVDNAIVISDGIAVRIRQGMDRTQAAIESATSSGYPLLAATIVAVMAFYPIYASTEGAGEYCQTLFTVVAIALVLSWFVAMMITPIQCVDILADPEKTESSQGEYNTSFYRLYRKVLRVLIRFRGLTLAVLVGMLALSIYGFGYVEQMFFPDSSRPQIMVDVWAPEGTRIQQVTKEAEKLEKLFMESPLTESVTSFIGAGPPRFYLPVDPQFPSQNYAQLVVNFSTYESINQFIEQYERSASQLVPNSMLRFRKYGVGPANTWKFEARFTGPAKAQMRTLRRIGDEAMLIAENSPSGHEWRTDMMNRTLRVIPEYDQKPGRWSGVNRNDVARTTRRGYDGVAIGLYRENDKLLPIIGRSTEEERKELATRFDLLQIKPTLSTTTLPLSQVVDDIRMDWEDPNIIRWNRRRAVTVQGSPIPGQTFPSLQKSVLDKINEIELPPGFAYTWEGEASSTRDAQKSLLPGVLPAIVIVIFMTVTVFNAYRPLIIIICTIPFAMIGVTIGLLALNTPFGFLALLGGMSLAGMMNKNIVVLLDACNDNLAEGMNPYDAIVEAAVTRVRPVLLAAGTTVLGVIPLVTDVFWTAMAVTIMAGLAFGSILTLVAVPVLFSTFNRVKVPKEIMNEQ